MTNLPVTVATKLSMSGEADCCKYYGFGINTHID